jgi:hypothetical protein
MSAMPLNAFNDWFNSPDPTGLSLEGVALKSERYYNDLSAIIEHPELNPDIITAWLQAAFEEGYKQGTKNGN